MKTQFLISLLTLFIILLTACAAPAPGGTSDWQTYSNPEAGFSISYPAAWESEVLPDQNNALLHGVALKGAEGGVELYWGVGLGGACAPEAVQKIKVAGGELQTCYVKNADGTESWENITMELPAAGFSARAYTLDAAASSRELVLQVVSSLSFP
jgi:hypothetical protein